MPARPRLASTSSATGPATARSTSRTGLLEPRTRTASPGSPSTRALATPRPLGHGNGCAATASATRRPATRQASLQPWSSSGVGGATEAQARAAGAPRRRRATGRATGRPPTPPRRTARGDAGARRRPGTGSAGRPRRRGPGRGASSQSVAVSSRGPWGTASARTAALPNGSATTGWPRSAAQATARSPRAGSRVTPTTTSVRATSVSGAGSADRMPLCRPGHPRRRVGPAVQGVRPRVIGSRPR